MSTEHEGVYLPDSRSNTYESTPLANAGWYEEGQHGGALAALIVGHVEDTPTLTEMQIARVTVEIFRVVPLVPLTLETRIIREGKRIQTIQVGVTDQRGTLLSLATIQRLRIADRPLPDIAATEELKLTSPDDSRRPDTGAWGVGDSDKPMFHRHAIEVREIHGGYDSPGPGAVWIRATKTPIAGRETSPAQRAVISADFCNGISRKLDAREWVFMNSDLTTHIARYPTGEWVALDAVSSYSDLGRGVASGTLWDEGRWVGRSAQTLYIDRV